MTIATAIFVLGVVAAIVYGYIIQPPPKRWDEKRGAELRAWMDEKGYDE